MTKLHLGLRWYLLAIFGNVLLYLLVAGLAGAPLMQSLADKWTLIFTLYLPALLTSFLVNPIGEETGCTGFALPRLQKQFEPWLAAVILGVIWAIWHLPAFFVPSEMGAFSLVGFIFFVLSSIFIRIIWTWVTNNAQGSGIAGILLHASSNAVSLALIPNLLPVPTPEQMAVSGLLHLGFMFLLSVVLLLSTHVRLSYRERLENDSKNFTTLPSGKGCGLNDHDGLRTAFGAALHHAPLAAWHSNRGCFLPARAHRPAEWLALCLGAWNCRFAGAPSFDLWTSAL